MDTFADVIHSLIDTVFHGDIADKAHAVIDRTTGVRSPDATAEATTTDAPAEATAEVDTGAAVPGVDDEAPPTPGG